jgi:hypothetical protein
MAGGDLSLYLSFTALIFVLIFPFLVVIASFKLSEIGKALKDSFGRNIPDQSSKKSFLVWDLYEKSTYVSGLIGFLAGIVIALSFMNSNETFGQGLSVSLVDIIYCIIIGTVFRILKTRVKSKIE